MHARARVSVGCVCVCVSVPEPACMCSTNMRALCAHPAHPGVISIKREVLRTKPTISQHGIALSAGSPPLSSHPQPPWAGRALRLSGYIASAQPGAWLCRITTRAHLSTPAGTPGLGLQQENPLQRSPPGANAMLSPEQLVPDRLMSWRICLLF